jgi:energy-converting hydrogenase Eha subunit G
MFAIIVYVLCAATSALCAVLLLRGYMKSRARLLFWSGLCFTGLALNNLLLVIDLRLVPQVDLSLWRTIPALIGISLLVYGLVWETR